MSVDLQQVKEIFLAAVEKVDPAERQAYLSSACGDNETLREQVDALLSRHAQAGSFLELPEQGMMLPQGSGQGVGATETLRPSGLQLEGIGTQIGPYKLLQRLGDGGMGVVWVAEQEQPVKRRVALKVIKPGMDTAHVIRRFKAERQALAVMDHPHIAKVLDAGSTPAGRPYFVMELVKGIPITAYCDEMHLSVPERLKLFLPVCLAIQHAHQKGIIHRDIKPSNVLVTIQDGEPAPKVIDFGVAKALHQKLTDQSLYTELGAVIGTLEYMSPEQAELRALDIDTRADLYALGVLLYELLTGTTPLDRQRLRQAAYQETLRLIREEEPPKPSTRLSNSKEVLAGVAAMRRSDPSRLTRDVRGDLDWIVMKCLEKDRTRRYASASGLARDIERHLNDEPVEACPPRAGYRLRKLLRRHRISVLTATAFAVVLLAASVISIWQGYRATVAEARALDNQRAANLEREESVRLAREREVQRNAAVAARIELEREKARADITLADMQTSRGLQAGREGDASSAALWFANAALLTPQDSQRQAANRLRARNWLNQAIMPAALLHPPEGHRRRILFQPHGLFVLTLHRHGMRIWDWQREWPLTWTASRDDVADANWSPDGNRLAVATRAGDVQILEPSTGNDIYRFSADDEVEVLQWSPDGQRIAVGGKRVQIWNVADTPIRELDWPHPQSVYDVAFNRSGSRLVTACQDDLARLFAIGDTSRADPLFAVEHRPDVQWRYLPQVCAPVFCDGDSKLVTIRKSQQPGWWDVETGRSEEPVWKAAAHACDQSLASSPDGRWVAVGGFRSYLLWNVNGESFERQQLHSVNQVIFHPQGQSLLSTCHDETARLWPISDSGRLPTRIPQMDKHTIGDFASDGAHVAIASDRQVLIWRLPEQNAAVGKISAWTDRYLKPRPGFDGQWVTPGAWHEFPNPVSSKGSTLTVARMVDGEPAGPTISLEGELVDSCLCANDRSVAVASMRDSHGVVAVFDVATGTPLFDPVQLPAPPCSVAARPGHPQVAVLCRDGHLQVINASTGAALLSGTVSAWGVYDYSHHVRVAYTPDGSLLTLLSPYSMLTVIDAETGAQRYPAWSPVLERGPCRTIAFSPDSRLLATGVNGLNAVQVWDLSTGRAASRPLPHPGDHFGIFAVAFSPDGQLILSGHRDGQLRLWDWKSGRLVVPPMQHPDEVFDCQFTPDGRHAVTAVRHSTVYVWDLATGKLAAPPLRYPVKMGESTETLGVAGWKVIASTPGYPVLDLFGMLREPTVETRQLLRVAELATNSTMQLGELALLDQAEWDRRWDAHVAAGGRDAELEVLLSELVATSDDDLLREWIGRRGLRTNLLDRLIALRPDVWQFHLIAADDLDRKGDAAGSVRHRQMATRLMTTALRAGKLDPSNATVLAGLMAREPSTHSFAPLTPIEWHSESGRTLTQRPDGSIVAGRLDAEPQRDSYTIRCRSPIRRIATLRLDTLPHDAWVDAVYSVTQIRAELHRADGSMVPLTFRLAASDAMRPIDRATTLRDGPWGALDGSHATRWDTWPRPNAPHWLLLELAEPCDVAEDDLIVHLDLFHRLGCFRLSVGDDAQQVRQRLLSAAILDKELAGFEAAAAAFLASGQPSSAAETLAPLPDAQDSSPRLLLRAMTQQTLGDANAARETTRQLVEVLTTQAPPRALQELYFDALAMCAGFNRRQFYKLAEWAPINQQLALVASAIDADPRSVEHLKSRGVLLARIGRWRESADDHLTVVELDPANWWSWEFASSTLLLAGDKDGYQRHCRAMVAQFRDTTEADIADKVCKASLLLPGTVELSELPIQVLRDGTTEPKWRVYNDHFIACNALISYREGKPDKAFECTTKVRGATGSPGALAMVVRAMSEETLGQHEQAVQSLNEFTALIPLDLRALCSLEDSDPLPAQPENVDHGWLVVEILRREAEDLILGDRSENPAPPTDPDRSDPGLR